MPYTNDPGESRQTLEALAEEHAQTQLDLFRCRCPRCDCFGVVSDTHEYYGIIYKCSCLPVFLVISPETGDAFGGSRSDHRIEEVES